MNDPGTPQLDWGSVFDRAHRRLAVRLILLAAIGALGAILLLGGGLKARGKLSLGFGHTAKKTKLVKQPPPRNPSPVHHREERTTKPAKRRHPVKPPPEEPEVPIVAPPVCVEEEDASGQQYCNGVPSDGGGGTAADEGNGGTTAEGEPEPEAKKPEPVAENPESSKGSGDEKPEVSKQPTPVAGSNG